MTSGRNTSGYITPSLRPLGSVAVLTQANMKSLARDDESPNGNTGSNNPFGMGNTGGGQREDDDD